MRPMSSFSPLRMLRRVSSDASVGPFDNDHPWPRSPGLECLQRLMPKGVPTAPQPNPPSEGDSPPQANPVPPLLCNPPGPPPLPPNSRSDDQRDTPNPTPPSPLASPTVQRRVRFASADGIRTQRRSLPVTAFECDSQPETLAGMPCVRPPIPIQFRFRACGSAVNLRRSRPAAKKTDGDV